MLAPRVLTLIVVALGLACLSTQPALAEENKEKATHALVAPAYMFKGAGAAIFLANTSGASVRAVVILRDAEGALIGCSTGLLKSGESDFLYLLPGPTPDTALTIKTYGLAPDGSLKKDLEARTGLAGNVTLLDGGSGEPSGVIELLEVPTTSKDRAADIEACLRVGSNAAIGSTGSGQAKKVLSGDQPDRWSDTGSGSESNRDSNVVRTSSRSSEKDKDKEKEKAKRNDD